MIEIDFQLFPPSEALIKVAAWLDASQCVLHALEICVEIGHERNYQTKALRLSLSRAKKVDNGIRTHDLGIFCCVRISPKK